MFRKLVDVLCEEVPNHHDKSKGLYITFVMPFYLQLMIKVKLF